MRAPRQVVCRSCGIELTKGAQFNRWTQCSVCYWRDRMQRQQPIEVLLNRRSDVRVRLDSLPNEIKRHELALSERIKTLESQAPWWRKVSNAAVGTSCFSSEASSTLGPHRERLSILRADLRALEQEHSDLDRAIEAAKKAKKRFLNAQLARNAADARKQIQAEEHEKFCNSSTDNLQGEFDRKNFHIQVKDYRRGNAIDNYFRNIEGTVLGAFNRCCVFCGTVHDLTFDHYGLSKNEGGNFVLVSADKASIRVNIVVLCRACNSAKGDRGYLFYFSDMQRARALSCQRALLDILLADQQFLKLVKKWSG
jgi:5-methylcytosine-specific restriction endonuclease McrA